MDNEVFPAVELARQAGKAGGCVTATYNAANEIAVAGLPRQGRIGFPAIVRTIADVLHAADQWAVEPATVDDVLGRAALVRERAQRAASAASPAGGLNRNGLRKVLTGPGA